MRFFWIRSTLLRVVRHPLTWAILAAGIATIVLVLHSRRYADFFFDDSFISLRYADRFRSGKGLTWTDGERVEGYTNFLWVVLVGTYGLFSRALIEPARVLGLVSISAAAFAIAYAHRPSKPWQFVAALFPGLALVSLGPVGAWARGGLEHPLLMALLAWAIVLLRPVADGVRVSAKRLTAVGILLGLVGLTRPDGIMLAGCVCAGLVLSRLFRRDGWRAALHSGGIAIGMVGAHMVFRRLYYDAWVPNTSSKLATSEGRFARGLQYVMEGVPLWTPLLAAAALALVLAIFDRQVRRQVSIVLLPLLAWCGYVAMIGGDFMPQRRHMLPALLLICMLAAEGWGWLVRSSRPWVVFAWVAAPVIVVLLWTQQKKDWAIKDANITDWYWEARPIGLFFRTAFGPYDPLLAVDAAGALPYFSRLRALDMLGLNDRWIAQNPKQLGRGSVAHDLGDGDYVLKRKPDLVVFHLPRGFKQGHWRSGKEMERTQEFRDLYQLLYYDAGGSRPVRGLVWVRREDGALGIVRTPCTIRIPGYLLATHERVVAQLRDGQVGAVVEGTHAGLLNRLDVPGGYWTLSADAIGAVATSVSIPGQPEARGLDQVLFQVRGAKAKVGIRVAADAKERAFVKELRLDRTDDAGRPIEGAACDYSVQR